MVSEIGKADLKDVYRAIDELPTKREFFIGCALSGLLAGAKLSDMKDPLKVCNAAIFMSTWMMKALKEDEKED